MLYKAQLPSNPVRSTLYPRRDTVISTGELSAGEDLGMAVSGGGSERWSINRILYFWAKESTFLSEMKEMG